MFLISDSNITIAEQCKWSHDFIVMNCTRKLFLYREVDYLSDECLIMACFLIVNSSHWCLKKVHIIKILIICAIGIFQQLGRWNQKCKTDRCFCNNFDAVIAFVKICKCALVILQKLRHFCIFFLFCGGEGCLRWNCNVEIVE